MMSENKCCQWHVKFNFFYDFQQLQKITIHIGFANILSKLT